MRLDRSIRTITNTRILDPETETLSEPTTIRISHDRIVGIGGEAPADRDAVLDAEGGIACPGLIDGHVHVLADTADLGRLGETPPSYITATAINSMQDALRRGFTSMRDAGGADFGLARASEEGLITTPRLFYGGKALSQTGGHADMRAPGTAVMDHHQCCPHLGVVCDGASEVRRAARNQLRTGAHHIKLMLSGGVASPTDRVDSTQFSDDEILAAVEEAEAANRYALGHAYTARAINRGLRLGVRSIEHGNLLDQESVRLLREHDAFLVPTLVTYERLHVDGAANGLQAESQKKVEDVLHAGLEALRLADEGGVNIVYGSDLLGDMRSWQSHEFAIRARVQSPGAVLRSATTTAARLLQAEGELGTISEGAHADLLLLDSNPLEDVSTLSEPDSSIRHIISRGGLLAV
ncbi:amidohydrolase family protein [Nesterenkonia halobia]|uniref:Amidohydrolase family protein n=1 Tax=Nesterenkonia halobia TaxID=37922 RepID=A0ABP6RE21_9MICC